MDPLGTGNGSFGIGGAHFGNQCPNTMHGNTPSKDLQNWGQNTYLCET